MLRRSKYSWCFNEINKVAKISYVSYQHGSKHKFKLFISANWPSRCVTFTVVGNPTLVSDQVCTMCCTHFVSSIGISSKTCIDYFLFYSRLIASSGQKDSISQYLCGVVLLFWACSERRRRLNLTAALWIAITGNRWNGLGLTEVGNSLLVVTLSAKLDWFVFFRGPYVLCLTDHHYSKGIMQKCAFFWQAAVRQKCLDTPMLYEGTYGPG